jgi:hypothetical protein
MIYRPCCESHGRFYPPKNSVFDILAQAFLHNRLQVNRLKLWLDIPVEVEVNLENESQLDQVMALVEQAFRQTI